LNTKDYTKGESDVEDYEVMLIMKRLSALYYIQQRLEDAKRLLENLMRLEEKTFGSEHPKIVITMQNLAVLYQDDSQYDEAKRLDDQILSIWEKVGSTEKLNLDFATAFYNLAAFYMDKEQYEQARTFYSRTINIRSTVLGLEDPDTQAAINGYTFVEKVIKRKRYVETAQHIVRRKRGGH
jgi:tetratricopeptide (TPR) repeat protein